MEASIFIAKVLGLVYLTIGLGMLFNEKHYRSLIEDMVKNPSVVYIGGVIMLIAGLAIATYHNYWEPRWPIIITILGWLALFEGVMTLLVPKDIHRFSLGILKKQNFGFWQVFILILGFVFCYFGFIYS